MATVTTIDKLKVGDIFQLKPNGRLYIRDPYNRITRKYEYSDYDDICRYHSCKGSKKVIID